MPSRVLLIGNEWVETRLGGLNRYLADLVAALDGAEVPCRAVVVGRASNPSVTGVGEHDAPLLGRLLAVRRATARLARSVDVVDAHFALYALLPVLATPLRRLPLVVHFQGPWADESRVARGQGRWVTATKAALERAVYRRAEVVVVLSEAFGRLVADRYGVDPSRVEVVPPGVDLDRFHPGDRSAAREALGVGPDSFLAVAVRRLGPRMGLDVLLGAWARVQRERPDAVLLVAGKGRERERLEAQCARLPDPDGVRLLGRVPDDELADLYRAADCSVVPTRSLEGFGLVTLESLACGTPAVVTDVGGLPDGVAGLDPTLVVAPEEPEALAERLRRLADGELPSPEACRRHAEQFSWAAVARHHREIYERARGRRPIRVAYVGHSAARSGGEIALARTLHVLDGVEAVVLLAEDGPLVDDLRAAGGEVEVIPMPERARGLRRERVRARLRPSVVLDSLRYAWRLRRRLRHLGVDLVHTNTLKSALYGGLAGRLARIPVVWHLRDRITPDYLPRPAVWLVRALSRMLPAAVVANSRATLRTVAPQRRLAAVVPSPGPAIAEVGGGERQPGVQRSFTVGLLGRLAPWKGQDLFLRAFTAAFPDGDQRAVLVGGALFGEDEWAASLPELAHSLGIAERVELTGFRDDVTAELARMDVLVHASTLPEPFGLALVEGMAAGLPVVAADAGGPAEVVTDGIDGLLYPMGDVEALAERLRRLADDPDLRVRLGRAARVRAQEFGPEQVGERVMDVYRAVLERYWGRRSHASS